MCNGLHKVFLLISPLLGNDKLTDFLIKKGANVNSEGNAKWYPLHWAAYNGNFVLI